MLLGFVAALSLSLAGAAKLLYSLLALAVFISAGAQSDRSSVKQLKSSKSSLVDDGKGPLLSAELAGGLHQLNKGMPIQDVILEQADAEDDEELDVNGT